MIEQDARVRGHGVLLMPVNISQIYQQVEKFSLKTNWKLAEGLLYNQNYKKDPNLITFRRSS